ncbi:MAG: hypothetical protein RLZZ537_958, partial [Pseudomonadota bacterium]
MQHQARSFFSVFAITLLLTACATQGPEPLRVDLDGDGTPERVQLDQANAQVRITAESNTPAEGAQTLTFGVDPARQDAVCALPVTLTPAAPDCAPEALGAQALPGCINKPA